MNTESAREDLERSVIERHHEFKSDDVKEMISSKLDEWENHLRKSIDARAHFLDQIYALKNAEYELSEGLCDSQHIIDDLSHIKALDPESDRIGDINPNAASKEERFEERSREQGVWNDILVQRMEQWEFEEIEKSRSEFIKSIDDWFRLIEEMRGVIDGVDSSECGFLWDMVKRDLYSSDIEELRRWLSVFKNDKEVRRICDLLGRMNSTDEEVTEDVIQKSFRTIVPDITSKEEIVSFELGKDIDNVVPHELAYLNDPEMSILFDLKYVEGRLLCFSKSGYMGIEEIYEEHISSTSESARGPIILCVDTSGSMYGTPEYIAKAVAFSIAMRAFSQKRSVLLINFSVGIDVLELSPPAGIESLLSFLRMSFSGGNDMFEAMNEISNRLHTDQYAKADVLFISDFIMPPDEFSKYKYIKSNGTRCYALIIGDFQYPSIGSGFFDTVLVYNSRASRVEEIPPERAQTLNSMARSLIS